jgi:tetratricopeptide (TPR) repeat protein
MELPIFRAGSFLLLLFAVTNVLARRNSPMPAASLDAARMRAEIQRIEDALPKIPDRGAALFLLARRYARLGELQNALTLLKECIALQEGFDPADPREFEPLRERPEFLDLVNQVRRQYPAMHSARIAFTIQEKDLFPEGLAADVDKHIFYHFLHGQHAPQENHEDHGAR